MRLAYLFLLSGSLLLFSHCSPDVTTVTIIRTPVISFTFNQTSNWVATQYSFADIAEVVVYPADTAQAAQVFSRLTLQASGKDSEGRDLRLLLSFDTNDPLLLKGYYTPTYTLQKGLAIVQLYDLTNTGDLSAYQLCDTTGAFLSIEKQNPEERVISGTFAMTLCDARDTSKKVQIINGIFKDIQY